MVGRKSDSFPVRVGSCQGCPFDGVRFGDLRIGSLQMMWCCWLHRALEGDRGPMGSRRFAAEYEAAGMRISPSESKGGSVLSPQ